jgi:DeoR/GlpR family transcriptional regulator of sugar metabolism
VTPARKRDGQAARKLEDTGGEQVLLKRPMLASARRRLVAEIVARDGSVTVSSLEQEFDISAMTARRDLALLEESGAVRRTHGGAVSVNHARYEGNFHRRVSSQQEAKAGIARRAARLVKAEGAVFLDSSSTSFYIAKELLAKGIELTVITNSLPILQLASSTPVRGITMVSTGGELRERSLSFVGPDATRTIASRFADLAFLSAKGLNPDGHPADAESLEAEVKRAMVEHASYRVLALDATKFDERGLNQICQLDALTHVVNDDPAEFSRRYPLAGELLAAET